MDVWVPRDSDDSYVRVTLERVTILDDRDPVWRGPGEIRFASCVTPGGDVSRAQVNRLPPEGTWRMYPGTKVVGQTIFDGVVHPDDDLLVVLTAEEEGFPDLDKAFIRYARRFEGDPATWVGSYEPGDEKADPKHISHWEVWYSIAVLPAKAASDYREDWGPIVWARNFTAERLDPYGRFDPYYWRKPLEEKRRMRLPDPTEEDPGGDAPDNEDGAACFSLEGKDLKCYAVEPPAPGAVFGDTGRFVAVEGVEEMGECLLKIALKRDHLRGLDSESLRVFWWDRRRDSYSLVEQSGLSFTNQFVWARIHDSGIYGVFGLPADRARRDTLKLACIMADWADLYSLGKAGQEALADRICALIMSAPELADTFDDLRLLEEHGLEDVIGRDMAEYGEGEFDEKGRPIGPRPMKKPAPDREEADAIRDMRIEPTDDLSHMLEPSRDLMKTKTWFGSDHIAWVGRDQWSSIGPTNYAGRVKAIVWHPTDVAIVYAANSQGGVYKSITAGRKWFPTMDQELSLAIGALGLAPSSPDTLYAGSGEYCHPKPGAGKPGVGIYKSTDGGGHWTLLNGTHSDGYNAIQVHPTDPDIVFAAGRSGLERSMDGGATWEVLLTDEVSDVLLDPTDPNTLYAACDDTRGLQVTSNAGETVVANIRWTAMNNGLTLAKDHSTHPRVNYMRLAATTDESGRLALWCQLNSLPDPWSGSGSPPYGVTVYRWDGSRWEYKGTPGSGAQVNWNSAIAVEPGNPDVVYSGRTEAYWTPDGGQSWHDIDTCHADNHTFAIHPTDPHRILVGNDGGIAVCRRIVRSYGGPPITNLQFSYTNWGHNTIQFERLAVSRSGRLGVGGSTQDQGVLVTHNESTWDGIGGAEWGDIEFYAQDGDIVLWDPKWKSDKPLRRSDDGGSTRRLANHGLDNRFAGAIAIHPTDSDRILIGTWADTVGPWGVVRLPGEVADGLTDFTFAAWIKTTRTAALTVVSGARAGLDNEWWLFKRDDGDWLTHIKGRAQNYGALGIEDGTWHHIAWVRHGGQETLYVDGSPAGTQSVSSDALEIASYGLVLGQEQDATGTGFDGRQAFTGAMDDVRVYSSAFSEGGIGTLMHETSPPVASMRARYRFDGSFDDSSGYSRHATGRGVFFTEGRHHLGLGFPDTREEGASIYLSTDGAAPPPDTGFVEVLGPSVVRLPEQVADGLGDFTIAMWLKTTRISGFSLFSAASDASHNELTLFKNESGEWLTYTKGAVRNYGALGIEDGIWYHIAWVRDGRQETLYVDGSPAGTQSIHTNPIAVAPGGLVLGQKQGAIGGGFDPRQAFVGMLDDVRIYAEALDAADVERLRDGTPISGRTLQAHYEFGGDFQDSSPNNFHAIGQWVTLEPGRSGSGARFRRSPASVRDIQFAPSNPDVVYAVTAGGGIWRSTDSGSSWDFVGQGPNGDKRIDSVTVDWTDENRIFIAYKYTGIRHVFRSDDGGGTWTDISGGARSPLPDIPACRLQVDTCNSNVLYVGTDIGVFRSSDGGNTWYPFDRGLPNALLTDLVYRTSTQTLYASTYGRGAYKRRI